MRTYVFMQRVYATITLCLNDPVSLTVTVKMPLIIYPPAGGDCEPPHQAAGKRDQCLTIDCQFSSVIGVIVVTPAPGCAQIRGHGRCAYGKCMFLLLSPPQIPPEV